MKKRPEQPSLNFWEKEELSGALVSMREVREEAVVHDDGVRQVVHQDVHDVPAQTVVLYLPSLIQGLRRERGEHQEQVIRDSIAIHQEYSWFDEDADEEWIQFWFNRIVSHREVIAAIDAQLARMNEGVTQ